MRVEKIVRTEVSSEPRFNNTFNYFRYEREVRNGAVILGLVIVQSSFLEDAVYCSFFEIRIKLARAKKKINSVDDCMEENRSTGFDKPGGNRIRITLLVRRVEENFGDFRLIGSYKSSEVGRC